MNETPPPFLEGLAVKRLKILGIIHYIFCGLLVVGMGGAVMMYLTTTQLTALLAGNPEALTPQGRATDFHAMNNHALYQTVGEVIVGLVALVLNLVSAGCLRVQKRRVFSILVAAFNCLLFPLGTILGVITIIMLCLPSGRAVYAQASAR